MGATSLMQIARALALGWPVALAVAGATSGCRSSLDWQHTEAMFLRPAPVRPLSGERGSLEPTVFRIRAYADEDYQGQDPSWAASITAQISRANAVLEKDFWVRLEVESVHPWKRSFRPDDLVYAFEDLLEIDPGQDVDWVVGWVGPTRAESPGYEQFGYARLFGRHFVVRAMESARSRAAVATWDQLTDAERATMAQQRRVHKEDSTFLHEWGHTLGAVHECPGKWMMSREYSVLTSSFSPESARLIVLGLTRRGAKSPDELRAWAGAYRDEASRMTRETWDCEVMEKDLARAEKLLVAKAAGSPDADGIDQAAIHRLVRRRMTTLKACYQDALERDPKLHGNVLLRFTIRSDGSIVDVIPSGEPALSQVGACLGQAIAAWSTGFRPREPVTVVYPFVFSVAR